MDVVDCSISGVPSLDVPSNRLAIEVDGLKGENSYSDWTSASRVSSSSDISVNVLVRLIGFSTCAVVS